MTTKRIRGILGEAEPFLNGSKASKLRVFDAILKTRATLYGAFALGAYDERGVSIIYSVEVDADKLRQLEEMARATLTPHDNIQVGFDVG
jgi:hypothetical protein